VLKDGGRLLIVDFAPHGNEFLREKFAHRTLGFSHAQMQAWLAAAGLRLAKVQDLRPKKPHKHKPLTVSIWLAETQNAARSMHYMRKLEGVPA
jgi:hypothetical protein